MPIVQTVVAKFEVGRLYMTRGVADTLHQKDVLDAFVRHINCDWGVVDEHDWNANEEALKDGSRLLSSYFDRNNTKFWIITEADRSATTILLPEEY